MRKQGQVAAVCLSANKGECKKPVAVGLLREDSGLQGDAHAGTADRQVSLLCESSIAKIRPQMRAKGKDLSAGDFAENLTLEGLEFSDFPPRARVELERGPVLEVTQIGKACHRGCAIREIVGDCVMPREGIFARVLVGGEVRPGDSCERVCDEA